MQRMRQRGAMMEYKKMEYSPEPTEIRLAADEYRNHNFVIKNLGWHPTAYVLIPKKPINISDIRCHCGVTYSGNHLEVDGAYVKGFWIGWDYGHACDYNGICMRPGMEALSKYGKKWTTEEIVAECKNVIDQLIEMGF